MFFLFSYYYTEIATPGIQLKTKIGGYRSLNLELQLFHERLFNHQIKNKVLIEPETYIYLREDICMLLDVGLLDELPGNAFKLTKYFIMKYNNQDKKSMYLILITNS